MQELDAGPRQDKLDNYRVLTGWMTAADAAEAEPEQPEPHDSLKACRALVVAHLKKGIEARYEKAVGFAEEIQRVLFEPDQGDLAPDDRQRCLITLLATRAEQFPLAIHMYVGLMEGIPIGEVRNILFLVGVYAGVPAMVNGIDVLGRILAITGEYEGRTDDGAKIQVEVLNRLKDEYSPGPRTSAPQAEPPPQGAAPPQEAASGRRGRPATSA